MTKGNAELIRRYLADVSGKREQIEALAREITPLSAEIDVLELAIQKLRSRSAA